MPFFSLNFVLFWKTELVFVISMLLMPFPGKEHDFSQVKNSQWVKESTCNAGDTGDASSVPG